MKPIDKAKEYAINYAENMFPYDIGGDDNWNDKNALVKDVAETACLFMHEWDKQQFIEWTAEWLQKNADEYAYIHVGCNESETYPYVKDNLLVEDFKKHAEEQL